ncbi:hypothetical protein LguiA_014615 [Lonicera macranthoides]
MGSKLGFLFGFDAACNFEVWFLIWFDSYFVLFEVIMLDFNFVLFEVIRNWDLRRKL